MRYSLCLFVFALCLPACARWSGTCHLDSDCAECESCQNGQCQTDPEKLNPCGDCAPNPPELCYDELDNNCDGLTDEGCSLCGNGQIDPGETCDGDCPDSCVDGDPCTGDQLTGNPGSCTALCEFNPVTLCISDDGCCPANCDRTNDSDCNLCGNGQLDPGETCDGDCPSDCDDLDACTVDSLSGQAGDCNVSCQHVMVVECDPQDGCCPPDCTALEDSDCIRAGWFKTYGGSRNDEFTALIPATSGGYLLAGHSESYGQDQIEDSWLIRLDPFGNILHQDTYSGQGGSEPMALVECADGVLLAGQADTYTTNWSDFRIFKTDLAGVLVWQTTVGSEDEEYARAMVQAGQSGFTVAGTTSNNWANSKGLVMHLDADGQMEWKRTYGESGEIYVHLWSIQTTPDGGTVVAGGHYDQSWDALLLKLDSRGDLQWKQAYGGPSEEKAARIVVLSDGYLLAGHTRSFGAGDSDIWLLRLDNDGAVLWQKCYGAEGPDKPGDLQIDPAGGFILAGETERIHGFTERQHLWLLRLDQDGLPLWQKAYGGNGDTHASAVLPIQDGYLVAGATQAFGAGYYDAFLMKTDSDGNIPGPCPDDFLFTTQATPLDTQATSHDPNLTLMTTNVTFDSDPLTTETSDTAPQDVCGE